MRKIILIVGLFLAGRIVAQEQSLFKETYRPQYHFSPAKNWTNDPNGLVYSNGLYHLFFQHNPFANVWGHMSWGHATSKDLIHWKELPVAIAEENGVAIFSGSAVVDKKNSTGFSSDPSKQSLIAIYTAHTETLQTQALAYSNDEGLTWKKYAGNPVLDLHKKDFRDPNVFWYEKNKQWVMAVSQPNEHQISFYASNNLKEWKLLSNFGPAGDLSGVWECPDLMQVPIVGEPGKTKWVLFTSQNSTMQYFVGEFDGTKFLEDRPNSKIHKQDYGTDYYAAVTYHNSPDKQPISIGWVNNWEYANTIPTMPWKSAMSLPRKLSVKKHGDDWVLVQQPIIALEKLRLIKESISNTNVSKEIQLKQKGNCFEMKLDLIPSKNAVGGIKLAVGNGNYFEIGYDGTREKLYIDRTNTNRSFNTKYASINRKEAELITKDGKIQLDIYFDESIVEIYAADGTVVFTAQVFPENSENGVMFFSNGSEIKFENIQYWKMKSSWF
ncbi:MAG: glycoside hydrolase family 32 protein [Bacteroidota bacterium]